ncbi:MAG TPA: preprotein translocase subunit SecE [Bacilli bacterium]|nr:preprotein translocase subunit SecE [Bacilli bacterium]
MKKEKNKKPSFFKGVKQEMSKVKWPDGKTMIKYTIATLSLVIFLGFFFYGLNFLFALLKGLFN